MGGKSSEREISLSTGKKILDALNPEKYIAFSVDPGQFSLPVLQAGATSLPGAATPDMHALDCIVGGCSTRPDVVFIALHGKYGEDGTVQGMLELLGIPYVGSGVLASALAIDKIMARKVLASDGIPMPKGIVIDRNVDVSELTVRVKAELGFPVVVKPNREGSSIGLSIPRSPEEFPEAVELAFRYEKDVLLEEFIEGMEITAPVIGNDELNALPLIEILPASSFYDYEAKYAPGGSKHVIPARISDEMTKRAQELAVNSHRSLGCRGMSRVDMIIRGEDIYVLEINTIPGMTNTSLLPESAKSVGIEFPQLLDLLIGYALERG